MNRLMLLLLLLSAGGAPLLLPSPARAQTVAPAAKRWVESKVTKRVALVMGNNNYQNGSKLSNPVNDATAITKVLKSLGFEVITVTDGTRRQMMDAIDTFGKKLSGDCVALCFYSGHGMQIGGTNYLLPVDFNGKARADVEYEAVAANRILGRFDESKSPVNILILDACRNNPFKSFTRGTETGLTRMDAPRGTLIAYATAPGDVADDNAGKANGLYTQELLKRLPTPGIKVQDVFQFVLEDVADASGGAQRPWVESSITGRLYLAKGAPAPAPKPVIETKNPVAMDTKARLVVTPNVPGATISVDGKIADKGNFALNLLDEAEKGVTVKVTAPDYEGKLIPVTLTRGKTITLSVTLEAAANVPTVKRVTLAYKAKVGGKKRVRSGAVIRLDATGDELQTVSEGTVSFTKIKPNGEITMKTKNEATQTSLNGEMLPSEADTSEETATMSATGEVLSYTGDDKADKAGNDYFVVRMQPAIIPILPANPVSEGDKWSHDYVANAKLGTRAAHADFVLLGFEQVGGKEAAKIKMYYKEAGTDNIIANGVVFLELSSGDVLRRDFQVSGLPVGPNGTKAKGVIQEERLSGSPLGN